MTHHCCPPPQQKRFSRDGLPRPHLLQPQGQADIPEPSTLFLPGLTAVIVKKVAKIIGSISP